MENKPKRIPPNAGKGRPKGSKNKYSKQVLTAVIEAGSEVGCELVGLDPEQMTKAKREGQLKEYLKHVAKVAPNAFCALLGKAITQDHNHNVEGEVAVKMEVTDARNRLVERISVIAQREGTHRGTESTQ